MYLATGLTVSEVCSDYPGSNLYLPELAMHPDQTGVPESCCNFKVGGH